MRNHVAVLASLTLAGAASAQTTAFTYQGRLRNGAQAASGLHDFRFRLFEAGLGGAPIGTVQCADNIALVDGFFTTTIDFGQQFATTAERYLEIDVRADTGLGCASSAGFTTLGPRQLITPAPHSLFALTAGTATSAATATNASLLNGQAPSFYTNAANLTGIIASGQLAGAYSGALTLSNAGNSYTGSGAGLTQVNADLLDGLNSTAFLQGLPNPLSLSGTLDGGVIHGQNNSFSSFSCGVKGTGAMVGVLGQSADTMGIVGLATSSNGTNYGGFFDAQGSTAVGVIAQVSGASATGVAGKAFANSGQTIGVEGYSASPTGVGVHGYTASPTGTGEGVRGESNGNNGRGVVGTALSTSGATIGVYGVSSSTTGTGVRGHAFALSGQNFGGFFQSGSPAGLGVYGFASAASGATKAVIGECLSPSGHAIYGAGNYGGSGTKSFRIDHPDDPENKYLVHYCAEGPEVTNFYSGTVALGQAGDAVIDLPHYFAKINRDPRYTLTAVGAPMPMLHIAREIDAAALSDGAAAGPGVSAPPCSFHIAGGVPGARVSWRVEAIRNDLWVQQRGAPVEVDKLDQERGTYQHPELYGLPRDRATYYRPVSPEGPALRPVAARPTTVGEPAPTLTEDRP